MSQQCQGKVMAALLSTRQWSVEETLMSKGASDVGGSSVIKLKNLMFKFVKR